MLEARKPGSPLVHDTVKGQRLCRGGFRRRYRDRGENRAGQGDAGGPHGATGDVADRVPGIHRAVGCAGSISSSSTAPPSFRTWCARGWRRCCRSPKRRSASSRPDVGGGFGYKAILAAEEICLCWLALRCGHPVRWIEDRREQLTANANCREHHYRMTAYADEERQGPRFRCRGRGRFRRLLGLPLHIGDRAFPGQRDSSRALRSSGLSLQDRRGRDQQGAATALPRGGAARRAAMPWS